jgi:hypothetical protein
LIDVGIQAVIIGLITFAPRFSDQALLYLICGGDVLAGSDHYIMIFGIFVFALIGLVYARGRVRKDTTA